jgi:hypothetical protein
MAILSELLRGTSRDARVNAALKRQRLDLWDVDRELATAAGRLLGAAHMDSRHAVDAFVAATTAVHGSGIIVTGDPHDLGRLIEPLRDVHIKAI